MRNQDKYPIVSPSRSDPLWYGGWSAVWLKIQRMAVHCSLQRVLLTGVFLMTGTLHATPPPSPGTAIAEPAPPVLVEQEARLAMQLFLQDLLRFSTEFTQTLTDETGFVVQEASGRMHLALPDQLRWELDAPYAQVIVASEGELWTWDPELRQATLRPLDSLIETTPLALLTQPDRLDERFVVRAAHPSPDSLGYLEPGAVVPVRLILQPRQSSEADFHEMQLDLTPDGQWLAMAFLDVFGQRTEFVFAKQQRNPTFTAEAFRLELPPGTDLYRP
jgi:outer membrane lipoprotein carrier protein